MVFCQPKLRQTVTRAASRQNKNRVKVYVFVAVDMYSHRIETAMLYSMGTDTLTSALHGIMGANGWRTQRLSLDPGSLLVPIARETVAELKGLEADLDGAQEEVGQDGPKPGEAAALVQGLRNSGFEIRTLFSKTIYRQASVESSTNIFKRTL